MFSSRGLPPALHVRSVGGDGARCAVVADFFGGILSLPIGPIVVPFWGSCIESYKVIPKRSYYGAHGWLGLQRFRPTWFRVGTFRLRGLNFRFGFEA